MQPVNFSSPNAWACTQASMTMHMASTDRYPSHFRQGTLQYTPRLLDHGPKRTKTSIPSCVRNRFWETLSGASQTCGASSTASRRRGSRRESTTSSGTTATTSATSSPLPLSGKGSRLGSTARPPSGLGRVLERFVALSVESVADVVFSVSGSANTGHNNSHDIFGLLPAEDKREAVSLGVDWEKTLQHWRSGKEASRYPRTVCDPTHRLVTVAGR